MKILYVEKLCIEILYDKILYIEILYIEILYIEIFYIEILYIEVQYILISQEYKNYYLTYQLLQNKNRKNLKTSKNESYNLKIMN